MGTVTVTPGQSSSSGIIVTATTESATLNDLFIYAAKAWTAEANYTGGAIVNYSETIYYCTTKHTASEWNENYWTSIGPASQYTDYSIPNWSNSVGYTTAPIYRTGSSPTFTFSVQANRYIDLQGTSDLTIEPGNTLSWNLTANPSSYQLQTQDKAILRVNTNSAYGTTIDFDTDHTYTGTNNRLHTRGSVYLQGTDASHQVTLKNMYRWYVQIGTGEGSQSTMPYIDVDYTTFQNHLYSTESYMLWFDGSLKYYGGNISFNNVTITNDNNHNLAGYGTYFMGDWSYATFSHLSCYNTRYALAIFAGCIKVTDSDIHDTYQQPVYIGCAESPPLSYNYISSIDNVANRHSPASNTHSSQGMVKFQNCNFYQNYTSSTNKYGTYSGRGIIQYRNCKFGKTGYTTTYAHYGYAMQMDIFVNCTYENIENTRYVRTTDGAVYMIAQVLTLTVKDNNGNVIEGAIVLVEQLQGKEKWTFHTNSNGKIQDVYGDDPIFITRETVGGSIPIWYEWSDGRQENRWHRITVSKIGYQTWTRELIFAAGDYDITATLMPDTGPRALPQTINALWDFAGVTTTTPYRKAYKSTNTSNSWNYSHTPEDMLLSSDFAEFDNIDYGLIATNDQYSFVIEHVASPYNNVVYFVFSCSDVIPYKITSMTVHVYMSSLGGAANAKLRLWNGNYWEYIDDIDVEGDNQFEIPSPTNFIIKGQFYVLIEDYNYNEPDNEIDYICVNITSKP